MAIGTEHDGGMIIDDSGDWWRSWEGCALIMMTRTFAQVKCMTIGGEMD